MKNVFKTALLSAAIFATAQSYAQERHEPVTHKVGSAAKDVGHATATAAKDVGHKTSELAAKGAAAVTDKRYDNKWGPRGEAIYYDSHSRYFYVDKRGHRNYITKRELRDKPYR
jgi:hypothetical protein